MAENAHLTYKGLSHYLREFIDAKITQQTSPDEVTFEMTTAVALFLFTFFLQAFYKLDAIATSHTEKLRKLTKQVQEHRQSHDDEAVKRVVEEYDETLEWYWALIRSYLFKWVGKLHYSYIPVLMAQAKIYWDTDNYYQVEKIFRKSVEFSSEHDVWKLNVAHVLFMQVSWIPSRKVMLLIPKFQETKFKEAAGFYEAIVKKNFENVSMLS